MAGWQFDPRKLKALKKEPRAQEAAGRVDSRYVDAEGDA
jgi:hypothetical protein